MANKLSLQRMRFVAEYIKDPKANGKKAAERAGYAPKSAAYRAYRLLQDPAVAAEIEAMRAAVRESAVYDTVAAMAELKDGMAFAKATKNATAFIRGAEIRAKLSGLLDDRIDLNVKHFDLGTTLAAARARVSLPALDVPFQLISAAAPALLLPAPAGGEPSIFD